MDPCSAHGQGRTAESAPPGSPGGGAPRLQATHLRGRMDDLNGETLGVVGGLGPLASAEFVRTVYRCTAWGRSRTPPGCS